VCVRKREKSVCEGERERERSVCVRTFVCVCVCVCERERAQENSREHIRANDTYKMYVQQNAAMTDDLWVSAYTESTVAISLAVSRSRGSVIFSRCSLPTHAHTHGCRRQKRTHARCIRTYGEREKSEHATQRKQPTSPSMDIVNTERKAQENDGHAYSTPSCMRREHPRSEPRTREKPAGEENKQTPHPNTHTHTRVRQEQRLQTTTRGEVCQNRTHDTCFTYGGSEGRRVRMASRRTNAARNAVPATT
jgi:hypothetical protein